MIEEKVHIKNLYKLKHIHDDLENQGFDYENKLLSKLLSGTMFENKHTKEYLNKLQQQFIWMIDSTLLIRNWWNYTIDKYSNNHNN